MTKQMQLSALIAETFTADETARIVLCDAGNGSGFGERGQLADYDQAKHAAIMMTATLPYMSDDRVECVWASDWIDGANGYRWRVRF